MRADELIERIAAGESAFDEVELSEGSLAGIALRRVSLRRARLIGLDLRGADLTGADLQGALLDGIDLRGAHLFRRDAPESPDDPRRFVGREPARGRPGEGRARRDRDAGRPSRPRGRTGG